MEPAEKAKELVKVYMELFGKHDRAITDTPFAELSFTHSKQCATICVDEIISTLSPYMGDNNARNYWQEVKAEIGNL